MSTPVCLSRRQLSAALGRKRRLCFEDPFSIDGLALLGNTFARTLLRRYVLRPVNDRQSPSRRFDRTRRQLLLLAAMAGTAVCLPGRAWGQSAEMSRFERTIRSLKIWWNHVTREPDEGDIDAGRIATGAADIEAGAAGPWA